MRVLVTGGGGFLGRYIVEGLLAEGHQVRILARGEYPELAALGVAGHRGSITDASAVAKAVADCQAVIHTAALAAFWGPRDDFLAVNLRGTETLLAASRAAGVERFVYTSSPSVVFGLENLAGADESTPYPATYSAFYPETKALGEQAVLAANDAELATCALRPHLIWGPRDTHIIPIITERAKAGQLARIGDGTNLVDLTYVTNAADAHRQALAALTPGSPVAGQAYFIGDAEPVNLWDWVDELLRRLELPPVTKHYSFAQAMRIAGVLETAHRLLPFLGEPRLTRFAAANFAKSHYFNHAKAARDFGYAPQVDNETGLAHTIAWYRQAGL